MPILQNYYISHQWLRELKRGGQRTIVGIHFRVSDEELVWVGHYSQPHQQVSVAEAIHIIMTAADPQGYEMIIPRSIDAKEICKIQHISQIAGWRYSPGVRARLWCDCPVCVSRGEINSSKKRPARTKPESYHDILITLRLLAEKVREKHAKGLEYQDNEYKIINLLYEHEEDDWEVMSWLYNLQRRKAGSASDLAFLLDYPSADVIEALKETLQSYKSKEAREMLLALDERACVGDENQEDH